MSNLEKIPAPLTLIVLLSFLFFTQAIFAASYIHPDGTNPGELHFNNIILDTGKHVSVKLIATDHANLHGGQVYELQTGNAGDAPGEQDGEFNNAMNRLTVNKVVESSTLTHDIILYSHNIDSKDQKIYEFTVIYLHTKTLSKNGNVLEEDIYHKELDYEGELHADKFYESNTHIKHGMRALGNRSGSNPALTLTLADNNRNKYEFDIFHQDYQNFVFLECPKGMEFRPSESPPVVSCGFLVRKEYRYNFQCIQYVDCGLAVWCDNGFWQTSKQYIEPKKVFANCFWIDKE
ncbi:MAG: hypothetical protein KZQ83_17105 [gamma proteobacterium symbiont of Taylorina sp.]|nr:hypothetical protein [gamma proteobacterium symbiont of Taylorina sp.]